MTSPILGDGLRMAVEYRIRDNINDNTYQTSEVERGQIEITGDLQRNTLQISFRGDRAEEEPFASYIQGGYGLGAIRLDVFDTTASRFFFQGLLFNVNVQGDKITFSFATPFSANATTDERKFQRTCPYFLYNPKTCKAPRANFAHTTTVSKITGDRSEITINKALSNAGRYVNGSFDFGGNSYWIGGVNDTATTVFLRAPVLHNTFQVGSSVSLYPACDKTLATCKNIFNNEKNYGGMPQYQDEESKTKIIDPKEIANLSTDLISAVDEKSVVETGTHFRKNYGFSLNNLRRVKETTRGKTIAYNFVEVMERYPELFD